MKLGDTWETGQTYRELKEKGSVTFHILNENVQKSITFFDENKKPIRESDEAFAERLQRWNDMKQKRYQMEQEGVAKDSEEHKKIDEEIYKISPSIKFSMEIINRETESKEILKMTHGAASQLNELFKKGYTAVSHDYILENTGKTGAQRYSVLPAPVKKPLTEKEQKAVSAQPVEEVVDPDEIPF